jgi:hypothetical protein
VVTTLGTLGSFARNAPGTVTTTAITGITGIGEVIVGADIRPSTGDLWVVTSQLGVGRLYTVNTTTGAATLVTMLAADPTDTTEPYVALAGAVFAVDFNPTGPVALRIVSDTGLNLRVADPAAGTTFTDGPIRQPAPDVFAAAYSNSIAGATATQLFVLDAVLGSLLLQNPPNDGTLTVVGALSAADGFTTVGGFDIAGGSNGIALAALQRSVAGTPEAGSRLYRINLATGTATEIGTGLGGMPLRGLSVDVR